MRIHSFKQRSGQIHGGRLGLFIYRIICFKYDVFHACRREIDYFPLYSALEATYAFVSRFPARENGRKMEEKERMAEHIDKHWTDARVIDTCPQEGRR